MIGGKRFAQNKPHHERPNAVIKDCTGLTVIFSWIEYFIFFDY